MNCLVFCYSNNNVCLPKIDIISIHRSSSNLLFLHLLQLSCCPRFHNHNSVLHILELSELAIAIVVFQVNV